MNARNVGPPSLVNGGAPALKGRGAKRSHAGGLGLESKRSRVPTKWRARLPYPSHFYTLELKDLRSIGAMGIATCPFHVDDEQSLTVALSTRRGLWTCRHCGSGDMVAFLRRRYGLSFEDSVRRLVYGQVGVP